MGNGTLSWEAALSRLGSLGGLVGCFPLMMRRLHVQSPLGGQHSFVEIFVVLATFYCGD